MLSFPNSSNFCTFFTEIFVYTTYRQLIQIFTRNHVYYELIKIQCRNILARSSHCGSAVTNLTVVHRGRGFNPWPHSVGQGHSCELLCRSQMRFRSCLAVTVVQASSCSSDLTSSLGTSIFHWCSPKKATTTTKYSPNALKKT